MKFYSPSQYQALCDNWFQRYRKRVRVLLPEAVVEHIGSSAIPGAISKGDLDVYVGVNPQELESATRLLCTLGFSEKQNTLRTPELCMLESKTEDVAFQIVAIGSQYDCFLHFRDRLRSCPDLVERYNRLKRSCEGYEQEDYRRIKSEFIEEVLSQ